jgi:hypothetical protein
MDFVEKCRVWDGAPPGGTGVPNLLEGLPLRRQFADEKAPSRLGSPTIEAFFNRIQMTFHKTSGGRQNKFALGVCGTIKINKEE